jgi:hypothetical protein
MFAILAVVSLFALPAPAPAPTRATASGDLENRFLRAPGDPRRGLDQRFGDDPKGYIMYDATGHMMVEFEKMPPPAKFASGDDWSPTPEEARAALLGYIAYFGTYTVDEAAHAVTHHVEGSLNPSYFGTDQLRPAKLEGSRLTLSDDKTFRVVWERVP